jgi:hypothetical protein
MKRVNSIPGAFLSTLNERAGTLRFAGATALPTFKSRPESLPRLYKAGVLIGDFLSSALFYIVIHKLRNRVQH